MLLSKGNRILGFATEREEVIASIRKQGDQRCVYGGGDWPRRCDCKYGGPNGGEQSGCPELACALHVLENLPDDLYRALVFGHTIKYEVTA